MRSTPPTPESAQDSRLARLAEICLMLPEAVEQRSGSHAGFVVRDRHFAYYLNDHHGDGIVGVCFKSPDGMNGVLIESDPSRFYRPAYIGSRGWAALRLDRGAVDWDEVACFILESYLLVAPKRLAAAVRMSI